MTNSDPFDTLPADQLAGVSGGRFGQRLLWAMNVAEDMGLRITSTNRGRHVQNSYHYRDRAFDAAGSRSAMRAFYRTMARHSPTELFYDPMGGIKHGRSIGAIGGHHNHVHVAF